MKLLVNKILNETDFESYLKIIESFNVLNPFYKILGSNLNDVIHDKLRYFTFINDLDEVLILMPFILRKVPYKDQSETYFDVISPYGYSGPLFNENLSRGYLIRFWEEVDSWYKQNNVISEFIRFSLDHNYQFYSGVLVPTLINVKGELIEEEAQWNNFKPKVRNNYRKSINNGLIAKFVGKEINSNDIETFYNIYIKTMGRIGADTDYFYDIDYFKNIVKLSRENFLIVIIFKDDVAISAELILISGDTLYSYLGGTLNDYFDLRPNDFLKIEVMKWARANNFKYYLLGGGREDYDSLYQYKKAFFPNDNDVIYYTGRKILNKKVYDKLDKIMNADITIDDSNTDIKLDKIKFFPAYRIRNRQ